MKNVRNIEIDGARLISALKLKNLNLVQASTQMGRNPNYLSNAIRMGYINPSTEMLIEKLFDIPLGMYIPTHPKTVEEPEADNAKVEIDYEQLQEAIYSAIMGAIRKLQREGILGGEA